MYTQKNRKILQLKLMEIYKDNNKKLSNIMHIAYNATWKLQICIILTSKSQKGCKGEGNSQKTVARLVENFLNFDLIFTFLLKVTFA